MRPGGSISRGGHSGRGNGSDEERRRGKRPAPPADPVRAKRVASDGGRKRGSRAYTNWGLAASPAYARREVEQYDRQIGAAGAARGVGSSALLPPPKKEEEGPEEEQREVQGAAGLAGRGYLPGDFVDEKDLDWVTAEVIERTKDEPQQLEADREMKQRLYDLQYRQAIEASRAHMPWGASDSD